MATILNGYWELYLAIGTRIEIEGHKILILWRNTIVTDTKFKTVRKDEKIYLELENKEMKYPNSNKPYGTVEELYYDYVDNMLHFRENFPITGVADENLLVKTTVSRYGDFTIYDKELLPKLRGKWEDKDGYFKLNIKGNTITMNGDKVEIHILRSNKNFDGTYIIRDVDSSKFGIFGFYPLEYQDDTLKITIPVCDAQPEVIYLSKKEKVE